MGASDRDLITRYRRGDVDALAELVERYRRPLFGYILNMTGGQTDADEVFQEVWFRAIKRLPRYRHGSFPGWLMRIAHNLVIDRARRRKPGVSLDAERDEGDPLRETIPGDGPDPRRAAEDRDIGARISDAVQSLPPPQKEVFLMRVQGDLPFKRIASIQGVSINTALARMHYATAKLRDLLREDYAELPAGAGTA